MKKEVKLSIKEKQSTLSRTNKQIEKPILFLLFKET